MSDSRATQLQSWLTLMGQGDISARDRLVDFTYQRLVFLASRMFKDFHRVRRWTETGDLVQNVSIRLLRAIESVKPTTIEEFFALAMVQIRRELLDLARHYFGPEGVGANYASGVEHDSGFPPVYERGEDSGNPAGLAIWSEFHQQIETLPPDERNVVNLLWY